MLAPALLFLLLLFCHGHVMLRCLKRHLLSKPAFLEFLFILNFGCCCVSCSISVVRPVTLHGCGSPLAHWSRPPHLIILTCHSPRPLLTPAVPHSLVSSVWFESTPTKTFTSVVFFGRGIKFSAVLVPFLHHTVVLGPNLSMSW